MEPTPRARDFNERADADLRRERDAALSRARVWQRKAEALQAELAAMEGKG